MKRQRQLSTPADLHRRISSERYSITSSNQKTGDYYALSRSFKLSDTALATICNITRDLPPDELVDAAYVKRTRHRLTGRLFFRSLRVTRH